TRLPPHGGRQYAPGRGRRRSRHRRARDDGGSPRRGPREREAPRAGIEPHRREPCESAGSRLQSRACRSEEERPPRRAVGGGSEAEGGFGVALRTLPPALRHAPPHLRGGYRHDGYRLRGFVERLIESDALKTWLSIALQRPVVVRALKVAAVIGTLLGVI